MTQIKICGLTEVDQAVAAAKAGADILGMVFATSSRQVTPEKAREIVDAIYKAELGPTIAGVFVNTPPDEVNTIIARSHLNCAQLSGNESWEYCEQIGWPVIKAIHISPESSVSEILKDMETGYRTMPRGNLLFLLDTEVRGAYGGTGKKFNWDIAKEIAARVPVIVAGGLTPENVVEMIEQVRPWGVDVSTGIETNGLKDIAKIESFIKAVRSSEKDE